MVAGNNHHQGNPVQEGNCPERPNKDTKACSDSKATFVENFYTFLATKKHASFILLIFMVNNKLA